MEISTGEISPCLPDESNASTGENAKKKPIFDKYLTRLSYTKRGKLALLILAVLCLVLFIVVAALAGAWPRWPRFIGNTCDKPSCLIASAQMLQSAELSSGVCQDPWIWACGGWQDNNIAKTIWSYKDELDYKETVRVRALIGSLPAGLPGSSEWILTELYNSCAATDNIEAELDLPLKKIIRDLGK
ncbi:kell blood group glycoprotein-like [Ctenocephalides felis]|uniref:kell blood group glycoprotein-like n=1 Tax=Ctenocephalides felis TaxID=7515 RepID=UPI000E6E1363|nr:kell blood group glycoprotein-like [Ctenocephalides felis]